MTAVRRTALVTGAGRNIGRACVLELASAGFNVVINGSKDRAACESVAAFPGHQTVVSAGARQVVGLDVADQGIVSGRAGSHSAHCSAMRLSRVFSSTKRR